MQSRKVIRVDFKMMTESHFLQNVKSLRVDCLLYEFI